MPRFDKHHEIVKTALEKDGRRILYDPFLLKYKGLRLYIDLAAERVSGNRKIAIEVKVFGGESFVNDFEKTLGQYNLYKFVLKKAALEHKLYLAISEEIFQKFTDKPAILELVAETDVHIIVFSSEQEVILQWVN